MRTSRKRKSNPQYGTPFSAASTPSPERHLQKMAMRLEDSLHVAAIISGASVFSWIVAVL